MEISGRGYRIGTNIAAVVAAACAFALNHATGALESWLTGAMVISACTSVFFMFCTSEEQSDGAVQSTATSPVEAAQSEEVAQVQAEALGAYEWQEAAALCAADIDAAIKMREIAATKLWSAYFPASSSLSAHCLESVGKNNPLVFYWKAAALARIEWDCQEGLLEQKSMLDSAIYILNHLHSPNYEMVLKGPSEIVIRQTEGQSIRKEDTDWRQWLGPTSNPQIFERVN